jgi:hypothetical protein
MKYTYQDSGREHGAAYNAGGEPGKAPHQSRSAIEVYGMAVLCIPENNPKSTLNRERSALNKGPCGRDRRASASEFGRPAAVHTRHRDGRHVVTEERVRKSPRD